MPFLLRTGTPESFVNAIVCDVSCEGHLYFGSLEGTTFDLLPDVFIVCPLWVINKAN